MTTGRFAELGSVADWIAARPRRYFDAITTPGGFHVPAPTKRPALSEPKLQGMMPETFRPIVAYADSVGAAQAQSTDAPIALFCSRCYLGLWQSLGGTNASTGTVNKYKFDSGAR